MAEFSEVDLRAYLLGRLAQEAVDAVEERSFADEAFFEQIRDAEDELIDDFVQENLSPQDAEQFAMRSRSWPGIKGRIRMRKAFFAALQANPVQTPAARSTRPSRWIRRFLIPGLAVAAGVLLAALVFIQWSHRRAAKMATATPARPTLHPKPSPAPKAPVTKALAVFFPQDVARGVNPPAGSQVRLHSPHEVTLQLELPAGAAKNPELWSVAIANAHGVVLSRSKLHASQFDGISFVTARFDLSVLAPGKYRVSLSQQKSTRLASSEWSLRITR